MNYIHGIIHPTPFTDDPNSTRSSKTLVLILLNLIISTKLFFNSNKKISNNFKFLLIYISIVSFLSYLYALGRSDGPHIKVTFAYPLIFQSLLLSNLIFIFISKKFFNIPNKGNNLILMSVFILFAVNFNYSFQNIKSFNTRIINFIELDDAKFLKKK